MLMVEVVTTSNSVIFEVVGWHRFLAMKRRIVVPFAQVRGVHADPRVNLGWRKGWRIPGTHIPGLIVAGTFYQRGRRIFWDVVRRDHAIVVDLEKHRYDQLIIEVEDPSAAVERLSSLIRRR
jgi:hypothetical protein